jgi:hypothetical protein
MTRHQRRKLAAKRKFAKALAVTNRLNSQLVHERVKANLSQRKPRERTPHGTVSSIYSGAANPMGYTRPLTYSKGAAK